MRGNELLDKMELIDPAYVEAADTKKKRNVWLRWCAAAACLCLIIGGFAAYRQVRPSANTTAADTSVQDTSAYGFYLEGNSAALYFPISFDERVRFGLVPNDAIGLTAENIYQITEADLGEVMGTVANCPDEALNGRTVYHFATYPDNDAICIADTPNGYEFYVCSWLNIPMEIGDSSDAVLAAYGLPDSLEKLEILAPDFEPLFTLDDPAVIDRVFELLAGKTNSGLEANERRFAQAWYDAYGNDDVYYSEEDGYCMYRQIPSSEEPFTYTDSEGNTVANENANDVSSYDKAHALWTEGERIIQITTTRGFQLTIDYFPSIRTFICADGYYELSADETETLSSLLQR